MDKRAIKQKIESEALRTAKEQNLKLRAMLKRIFNYATDYETVILRGNYKPSRLFNMIVQERRVYNSIITKRVEVEIPGAVMVDSFPDNGDNGHVLEIGTAGCTKRDLRDWGALDR